ncbi:MAG: phosphatidylglycerophosphatase A [Bacteroidales bacterium]|nr:phosphatidylglycerophosphatase A [Bacteroidales bacterium]
MEQPTCFQKILSTGFGCGYSPIAPGTVGALLMWIVWIMLYAFLPYDIYFTLSSLIFLFFAYFGTKAAGAVEVIWGKDPSKVVVDEMIGVLIPLMTIGSTAIWFYYSIAAFILFRLFDIFKPLGIRRLERLKGGVGIMADDVLSGLYSAIILLIAQWFIG